MSEAEAVKKSILEMAKSVAHVQDEVEKFSPPDKGDGDPAEAILNIRKVRMKCTHNPTPLLTVLVYSLRHRQRKLWTRKQRN